jgi:hypothetical protein
LLRAVCAGAIAALALAAAAGGGLGSRSDEFAGSALTGWNVLAGDDTGDGTQHSLTVQDGSLVIVPRRSWWVDNHQALYLWKAVAGDFVATMRVRITGEQAEVPQADWTLSGILVRDRRSNHSGENWVSLRTGVVGGTWVYERKTTSNSHSALTLDVSSAGWVELRVARVGDRFFLLRRDAGAKWVRHWMYVRPDLPKTLQVGIDAFSGYDSPHADMISRVDWFHFASTGVPARLRNGPAAKLLPYLTR